MKVNRRGGEDEAVDDNDDEWMGRRETLTRSAKAEPCSEIVRVTGPFPRPTRSPSLQCASGI